MRFHRCHATASPQVSKANLGGQKPGQQKIREREREREGERERERKRERERERQTERHTHTHTRAHSETDSEHMLGSSLKCMRQPQASLMYVGTVDASLDRRHNNLSKVRFR